MNTLQDAWNEHIENIQCEQLTVGDLREILNRIKDARLLRYPMYICHKDHYSKLKSTDFLFLRNAFVVVSDEFNPGEEGVMSQFEKTFTEMIRTMQHAVHQNAQDHGWWEEDRSDGELIALEHSELSEALEAFRHGNPQDKQCPEFSQVEIELADCIIRILDHSQRRGYRIGQAIIAKHEFNKSRPYKHGGKKF